MPFKPYLNKLITLGVDLVALGHEGAAVYTPVEGLTNLVPPNEGVDDVEVTTYASTGKEYLPGLYDGGEVTIELEYDPADATHASLQALPAAGTVHSWRIAVPAGKTITWDGYGKSWTPNFNKRGEALTSALVVKVTGVPVYANPS